jgi:hypothetical protein
MKNIKNLKALLVWTFAAVTLSAFAQSVAPESNQCMPEVIKRQTVVGVAVNGELSGFDPCHSSVSFKVPAALTNSKNHLWSSRCMMAVDGLKASQWLPNADQVV